MTDTMRTTARRETHAAVAAPLDQPHAVAGPHGAPVLAVILGLLGTLLIL